MKSMPPWGGEPASQREQSMGGQLCRNNLRDAASPVPFSFGKRFIPIKGSLSSTAHIQVL